MTDEQQITIDIIAADERAADGPLGAPFPAKFLLSQSDLDRLRLTVSRLAADYSVAPPRRGPIGRFVRRLRDLL